MSNSLESKIEVLTVEIRQVREDVTEIKTRLENNYVTRYEFDPIKKLVYGLVSIVLTAVVGALVALVLIK